MQANIPLNTIYFIRKMQAKQNCNVIRSDSRNKIREPSEVMARLVYQNHFTCLIFNKSAKDVL